MLLQTNSYIVPKDKRAAHNHLMQRFRQVLMKIGCDHFEVYEQVGANWAGGETSGRFVQMMRFRDRKHCQAVQQAERTDPAAQALVREFCALINFDYQEAQGLFAHGYYQATIEPIRLHRDSDLAFHATSAAAAPFDPNARVEPPEPQPAGPAAASMSELRKPAEGESDPADDELIIDELLDEAAAPDVKEGEIIDDTEDDLDTLVDPPEVVEGELTDDRPQPRSKTPWRSK